ncbi:MAG: agmatinase [Candidatus Nanopelagicaceae bacterium]
MADQEIPRVTTGDVIGQVDATKIPRYGGLSTFALLPRLDEVKRAEVAVVGVPFDAGVSYRPGARFGPSHVREASRLLRPFNPELKTSPFASQQVVDAGDFPANPFDIEAGLASIESSYSKLLDSADKVIAIGGDHTITLAILRALKAKHGPISVIHFDAHLDTWDSYFGADYTHGTTFRRASEEGLLDQSSCIHIGIRGPLYAASNLEDDQALGFQIFSAVQIEELGITEAITRIKKRVSAKSVYISIDIDVLDPAHAPGTGTPEAGGMTSRELLQILRASKDLNVVGADVVEVAPAYDHAQLTGIAASHCIYEMLSAMVKK